MHSPAPILYDTVGAVAHRPASDVDTLSDIFSSVRLGDIELANRIVMAAMTRDRAGPHDEPTDIMVEYYRQRSTAGLIITEGTQPSAAGKGYYRTPGIHAQIQIDGWCKVTNAVHGEGGRIVMQLMHCGRAAVRANKDRDAETIAPSAVRCRESDSWTGWCAGANRYAARAGNGRGRHCLFRICASGT